MVLSVIIPTFNEEVNIKKCIEAVKKIKPDEIIVVDGGSSDRTVDVASCEGVRVIKGIKGRGKQIKTGIDIALGDVILILHADTLLPSNVSKEDFSLTGKYCAGFFKLRYDSLLLLVKLVEFFANLRSYIHSLPYGDQAIFVKKDALEKIGGIRDYPFLEDVDLVLRLRRYGRFKRVEKYVTVSARKLLKGGFFYPILHSLKNVFIVLLFFLGVSPESLKNFYQ